MHYMKGCSDISIPLQAKIQMIRKFWKQLLLVKQHSISKEIPANRGFEYCTLDRDRLNTIRTQLNKLKVVFIDEISVVGSGMFNFLNLRLQQIMGTNKPFDGVSIISVGDLFQLKPVFDKWIFENSLTIVFLQVIFGNTILPFLN